MARFFVDPAQITGDNILIQGEDVNHIKNVLRLSLDDELILCDGRGKDYKGIISKMDKESILITINEVYDSLNEPLRKITLYQGLPKKDKMELIIQKSVELGISEIVPVIMDRVIVQIKDKKKEQKKVDRWNKISESAAKQSRRGIIPKVHSPIEYKKVLEMSQTNQLNIMAYENEKNSLKKVLDSNHHATTIGILIGPEGGLTDGEVSEAINKGFYSISLGKRILRTETAGLALTSIIIYALDEM